MQRRWLFISYRKLFMVYTQDNDQKEVFKE